jgi:hypothetical protein
VLGHCEGFRVVSSAGVLGYVEEIVRAPGGGAPLALHIWTGADGRDQPVVMVEDALELRAESESIVIRR